MGTRRRHQQGAVGGIDEERGVDEGIFGKGSADPHPAALIGRAALSSREGRRVHHPQLHGVGVGRRALRNPLHAGAHLFPLGKTIRRRRIRHGFLVGDSLLGEGEARRHGEDGLAALIRLNPTGGEAAALSNAVDHHPNRPVVAPRTQKVAVKGVEPALGRDRPTRGDHALRRHHSAEQATFALPRIPEEEIAVEGVQVEALQQSGQRRVARPRALRHVNSSASRRAA